MNQAGWVGTHPVGPVCILHSLRQESEHILLFLLRKVCLLSILTFNWHRGESVAAEKELEAVLPVSGQDSASSTATTPKTTWFSYNRPLTSTMVEQASFKVNWMDMGRPRPHGPFIFDGSSVLAWISPKAEHETRGWDQILYLGSDLGN